MGGMTAQRLGLLIAQGPLPSCGQQCQTQTAPARLGERVRLHSNQTAVCEERERGRERGRQRDKGAILYVPRVIHHSHLSVLHTPICSQKRTLTNLFLDIKKKEWNSRTSIYAIVSSRIVRNSFVFKPVDIREKEPET